MKIASWNVNSVKARQERLLAWLSRHEPDVLCLQELKCQEPGFPREAVAALGYKAAVFGQKTYNGVAILAKSEPEAPRLGFSSEDPDARIIAATVAGVRVVSAYIPNGGEMESEKYAYKRAWLAKLEAYLQELNLKSAHVAVCGDFNIARDALDVHDEAAWEGSVLYNPEMRAVLDRFIEAGLVDTLRKVHPEGKILTWWDYRQLAFPKNNGLRIDYVWASQSLSAKLKDAYVDRDERKGKQPSDHAPAVAIFDL